MNAPDQIRALRAAAYRRSKAVRRFRLGTRVEERRHEWIERACRAMPAGQVLVDVGAGQQIARPWCNHLHYVAQDLAIYEPGGDGRGMQDLHWDYGRLDVIADAVHLPFATRAVDAVLCSEVLEHLPDPVTGLAEVARIIAPGGELLLTAPFSSLTHFAPHHYAVGFNRYFYEKHLPLLGLEIVEITSSGTFFDVVAIELRRSNEVASHYGNGLRLYERIAAGVVMHALGRVAEHADGSSELLTNHWFVRARRSR